MDINALLHDFLSHPAGAPTIAISLPDADAANVIEKLKSEADRHWEINAHRSLEIAGLIVAIGQARGDLGQTALGMMACGDALNYLGRIGDAWQALEQAGALFQAAGDDFGWARTRIGRLQLAVELNAVVEALEDAERARAIFVEHANQEKQYKLDLNIGLVHYWLGNQALALEYYQRARVRAEALCDSDAGHSDVVYTDLARLYTNMGISYDLLGDFRQALACHTRAHALFAARGEQIGAALVELNMAHIAMAQGNYRHALKLLHQARDCYMAQELQLEATKASRDMIDCYLELNRYDEARTLALQVLADYRSVGASYMEGLTLLHLAAAEAELEHFAAAQAALDQAEPLFVALGASALVSVTHQRRGQIALKQGNLQIALQEALAAAAGFAADGQRVHYAQALILKAQVLLAEGDLHQVAEAGLSALAIARQSNLPQLRYSAHLLLGHLAKAQNRLVRAARHYSAAVATVERVQHGLTITLRTGFLEDKGEALRALLDLHLRSGRAEAAFTILERAKSQVLLGYLANREALRWRSDDPRSHELINELNQLREEHHWFYRLAHERAPNDDGQVTSVSAEQALAEVAVRERQMRAISEQLYLLSGEQSGSGRMAAPRVRDIQQRLEAGTLLVEFYNDGTTIWAFMLDRQQLRVQQLPSTVTAIDQLLARLQSNISIGLSLAATSQAGKQIARLAQLLLQRLYDGLLAPLAEQFAGRKRLVIVPYGSLHYLPFHLLFDGTRYVIETHEVVILPAAGLITRTAPVRDAGARILAHSWEGRLPQTRAEAHYVQRLFGGESYIEQNARRAALEKEPAKILHIAAHGEQRLDQPDLSYIQLDDGQLYTDDLLQQDLSYELVVLSACETGRANVAAGDELIGLGRGFLYAGAGALITSLWRVEDTIAQRLMERLYASLLSGASKAAALRAAQCTLLAQERSVHPALWGAFQLVGDAGPLSEELSLMLGKDVDDERFAPAA